jgi:uncharacterized protein (TIGR00288 family)
MPADYRMNADNNRSNRIAVFIDFDNVEIGVKSTIGGQFDIGTVLEAIKERGEIVTKIAYSDWKRAGDYSRILTQHAIRMVQRSFTPGGDKNGADITMALDALEMAFTHDHINTYVIVGGDSDFISLVEKLKQYGRKVIVVGGRQFTSLTMQKNCHEFIAYENLVGSSRGRSSERGGVKVTASSDISKALPIVKRALKVLQDREVTPQLGVLKSTLLQLDSTFSEREYGASTFRDFMEKVAQSGAVVLRHSGRSMLVEPAEDAMASPIVAEGADQLAPPEPIVTFAVPSAVPRDGDEEDEEAVPASPMSMQDGVRAVQQAFANATTPPRWPMYVRQAKQFLRNAIESFDERKYGFASVVDLLRAAGKEGVLRLERDRQGAIRVFPGVNVTAKPAAEFHVEEPEVVLDENVDVHVPEDRVVEPAEATIEGSATEVAEPPVVDGQTIDDTLLEDEIEPGDNFGNREQPHPVLDAPIPSRRSARKRKSPQPRAVKQPRSAKAAKATRPPGGRRPPRRKPESD